MIFMKARVSKIIDPSSKGTTMEDYCLACYQPAFIYNTVRNKNTSVFMRYNEICCVCITHSYQIVNELINGEYS